MPAPEQTLLQGLTRVLTANQGIPDGYFEERQESFGYPLLRFTDIDIKDDPDTYTDLGEVDVNWRGPLMQEGSFAIEVYTEGVEACDNLLALVKQTLRPKSLQGYVGSGAPIILRTSWRIKIMGDRSAANKVIAMGRAEYKIVSLGMSY